MSEQQFGLEIKLLRGDKKHTIEVELPERSILQGDVRRFKN